MQKCTESKGNLLVILSHAQCFIKLGLKSGTKEEGGIGCSYMFVSIARSLLHYYHFIMHFIYLFVSCILYSFAYTLLFTYYYYLHIHFQMHIRYHIHNHILTIIYICIVISLSIHASETSIRLK